MPRVLVGTSGFSYAHWRGVLYPPGLPQTRWLEHYAARFPTAELNNPFYRLPSAEQFKAWARRVPEPFVFAVKASRYITHVRRLQDVSEPVTTFLSRAGSLGGKLGPVLFQLPPFMEPDLELLGAFLSGLPGGPRYVLEFRHPRWHSDAVLDLLRAHGIALCVHDKAASRCPVAVTAPFFYLRLHGPGGVDQSYTGEELVEWAERLNSLAGGVEDAYVYFNNDVGGHAIHNARTLTRLLSRRAAAA